MTNPPLATVILIDRHQANSAELAACLRLRGHVPRVVDAIPGPTDLPDLLARNPNAAIVLRLPAGSTGRVAALRQDFAGPLVVLLDDDQPACRIARLDEGADAVLSRHATPAEVRAVLEAVLRRAAPPAPGWWLDARARDLVCADGSTLDLTSAEYELLACLERASGQPVARDILAQRALRRSHVPGLRGVDALVVGLRRKITEAGGPDRVIKSVRGIGYACPPVAGWGGLIPSG